MYPLHHFKLRGYLAGALALTVFLFGSTASAHDAGDPNTRAIDIASINLYVGADFAPVLSLNPLDPNYGQQLLSGVATIYQHLQQSRFDKRADALAREIVRRGPDVVALQEVSWIRRQSPGDSLTGGTQPATATDLDYLAVLLEALQRHGGQYRVVSEIQDVDVEVPLLTSATTFDDLRLTDRDVILARTDLPPGHLRTFNPQAENFGASLPLPIGVSILRGWCSIDVMIRGRQVRVINTHLEDRLPAQLPNIQMAQAAELLAGPADTALPVILAGDFNSDAFNNYSPETYALLTGAGFADLWTTAGRNASGFTWGHDALLADPNVPLILRLDLVLYRGQGLDGIEATVADPVIDTVAPLWFSDHAGLFGRIAIE